MNQYTQLHSVIRHFEPRLSGPVMMMLAQLIHVAETTQENKNIPNAIETLIRNLSEGEDTQAFEEYLSKVGDSSTIAVIQQYLQDPDVSAEAAAPAVAAEAASPAVAAEAAAPAPIVVPGAIAQFFQNNDPDLWSAYSYFFNM